MTSDTLERARVSAAKPRGRLGRANKGRTMQAACYDCGLPYSDPGFADLLVPNDVWNKAGPTGHEGGLLCPTCLVRACEKAGFRNVLAQFTSGPFALHLFKRGAP